MSKNTKFVIGIVIFALLCSSIPVVAPLLFGIGNQSGAISPQARSQLLNSVFFIGVSKFSSLNLLISIIGLALSLYFRQSNRKKFRVTSIAFGLILVGTIITGFLSAWIDISSLQASAPQSQAAMGYTVTTCIASLVQIASWVLLLVVIFSQKYNELISNP